MSIAPFRKYSGISFVIGVGIVLGVTISFQFGNIVSSVGYAATSVFIPNCTDTDGGKNIGKKGRIVIGSTEFDESCKDATTLTEFECATWTDWKVYYNADYVGTDIVCPQGCLDGVCIDSPDAVEPTVTTCQDSDGGRNYDVRGEAGIPGHLHADTCATSQRLLEYDCGVAGGIPISENCGRTGFGSCGILCPYGCQDGACMTPTTPLKQNYCVSSGSLYDKYAPYATQSRLAPDGPFINHEGVCQGEKLIRMQCITGAKTQSVSLTCPNGCANGLCLQVSASSVSGQSSSVSSSISSSSSSVVTSSSSSVSTPFPSVTDIWFEQQAKCNDITNGGNDCITFDLWVDVKMPNGSRLSASDSLRLTLSEWIPDYQQFMFPTVLNKQSYGMNPMFMMTMTMPKSEVTPTFKFQIEVERGGQRQVVERTVSSVPRIILGAASFSSKASSLSSSQSSVFSSSSSTSSSGLSQSQATSSSSRSNSSIASSSAASVSETPLTSGQRILVKIRERLTLRIDQRLETVTSAPARKILEGIRSRLIKRIDERIRKLGGGLQ